MSHSEEILSMGFLVFTLALKCLGHISESVKKQQRNISISDLGHLEVQWKHSHKLDQTRVSLQHSFFSHVKDSVRAQEEDLHFNMCDKRQRSFHVFPVQHLSKRWTVPPL